MSAPADMRERAVAVCVFVLVFCALVRTVVNIEPFPMWDADPTIAFAPPTALGPWTTLLLDAVGLVASGVLLTLCAHRLPWWAVLLWLGGTLAATANAWWAGGPTLDNLRIGSQWVSAVTSALALFAALVGRPRLRAWVLAAALGVLGMLVAKAGLQVFYEHPLTVADYRQHRETFLSARGWAPGSPQARAFERRLFQPDATAWFGLANVTGTFAAFGTIAFAALALLLAKARGPDRRPIVAAVLGTFACCWLLWVAGSKGAWGAVALAAVGTVAGIVLRHRATLLRLIGPGVVVAVLAGITVRGLIGERLSELSLLFRWFYVTAATHIGADHPLLGVGPGGFKTAYLMAKNPLSPEEVTSPHSLLFDWWACLGVGGVCWGALLIAAGILVGRALTGGDEPDPIPGAPEGTRSLARRIGVERLGMLGLVMACTAVSALVERDAATTEVALGRVAGLVAWAGASVWLLGVLRRWGATPIAAGVGALVVLAHIQIEVTGVWPGSAHWVGLVLAAAAASRAAGAHGRRAPGLAAGAMAGALGMMIAWAATVPIRVWETRLVAAAEIVAPIAQHAEGRRAVEAGDTHLRALAARALADALGLAERTPPEAAARAWDLASVEWLSRSAQTLERASAALGMWAHPKTARVGARVAMRAAEILDHLGERGQAREWAERAEALAEPEERGTAEDWYALGALRRLRSEIEDDPGCLARAMDSWERAAALDPYGLEVAWALFRGAFELGQSEKAARWGAICRELNDLRRLDALRQLTREQLQMLDEPGLPP